MVNQKLNSRVNTLIESLTDEQRDVVLNGDGYTLVIAGAGTGKTKVLTHRIAYLLAKGIPQENMVALTFTNKAADEMRSRIQQLIGWKPENLFMGTFHSFASRILRVEAKKLGYTSDFSIYDRDDQKALLKHIIEDTGVSGKPESWVSRISLIKSGRRQLSDYHEAIVLERYQRELKNRNAMDFDDLLQNLIELFQSFPETAKKYARRYKYILVDEYQDTNRIQFEILRYLSSVNGNLFVVGDEDQSIYSFRGADIKNILDFQDVFPDTKVFRLQQNFRSTKTIIRAATVLINNNQYRLGKELWTSRNDGEKILLRHFYDETDEARWIAEYILDSNRPYRDFLILFRTNFQSRPFEEVFPGFGIPYDLVGTIRFYERKEIKDIFSYLKFSINPLDWEALRRSLNTPPRGLGPKTLEEIQKIAHENSMTYLEALELLSEEGPKRMMKGITDYLEVIALIQAHSDNAYNAISELIRRTGYLQYLEKQLNDPTEESKLLNIQILLGSLEKRTRVPTVREFLQESLLRSEIDDWEGPEHNNRVTLMTVHLAKGLEFPVVIISGLEEGIFPHKSSFNDEYELEEERRLFHVALTRAKDEAILTFASKRLMRHGRSLNPSRFLRELPEDTITGDIDKLANTANQFSVGDHIYHPDFGEGKIIEKSEGRIKVRFRYMIKVLSIEYAPIRKI